MASLRQDRRGGILVLTLDNPPVNALGASVRAALIDAVEAVQTDIDVAAIVLCGSGKHFSGGADIAEFGKPPIKPTLPELIAAVEASSKPVVAALHGSVLGGGLELALGCAYRIAGSSSRLGLPEVKLGIVPGAGGTQRLPRVIGTEAALEMIVSGEPITAVEALELGLVDALVREELLEVDAITFAREKASEALRPVTSERNDRLSANAAFFDRFRSKHAKRFRGFAAPDACVRAVQAATTLPFAEGLAFERALFLDLVASPQSQALRHTFFAERQAAKIENLPAGTPLLEIETIGIIGAGTMGSGIATCFLAAGFPVSLLETTQLALDRGVAHVRSTFEASMKKGRITADELERAMAQLHPTLDMAKLADSDLIIEAVFELMEIKTSVFRQIDGVAKDSAILATNTSYLDVNAIAAVTRRPEQVVGLHFFSPAHVMKLLEVVRGAKTSDPVLATAMQLARRIGKIAVAAGVCHGFIGNRMLARRQAQANALILEGARPADVDRVLVDFGFPMGPFQMSDLAGLDIGWDPARTSSASIKELLCERGRRGQKAGKGFYDYDVDRRATSSPEVDAIIADFAARLGKGERRIDDDEIRERLLYPMINEAAMILDEGIAQRASDIDVVWLNGYGWPARTGGPLHWADGEGLDVIVVGLERHADRIDGLSISPLLRDMAARGESFGG